MRGKRALVRIVLVALALVVGSAVGQGQPATFTGASGPVPREYWGLHIHRAGSLGRWPAAFGAWRLWDARVAWPNLEPNPGQWRFDALDEYVEMAREHRVEILLPLGMSPSWASARPTEVSSYSPGATAEPADLQRWRDYVRTVAQRYKGRVRHYEIWNEPNLKQFYTGSTAAMVDLAREAFQTLKAVDPDIVVVSPAATERGGIAWLDEYLRRGGAQYADVIGYHFYVAPMEPEAMVPMIRDVQQMLRRHGVNKPVWNTESGWMIPSNQKAVSPRGGTGIYSRILNEDDAAAFVARACVLNWASGVERLYWYAWDNFLMGLVEPDGRTVKPAGRAYQNVQDWMTGARVRECQSGPGAVWTCQVTRDAGNDAWIVWSPNTKSEFAVPSAWRVHRVRTLAGETRALEAKQRVAVGAMPVLLEQ